MLRAKVYEPIYLLGPARFADLDIRVRVRGGGQTSQVYAVRQAIARAIVAFYQKCKRQNQFNYPQFVNFSEMVLQSLRSYIEYMKFFLLRFIFER